jgi:diguanylate cyclase (GGDEF)-like protein
LDYHIGKSIGTDILSDSHYLKLKLPIVLITGQGDERIAVKAIQDGIYDYIPKAQLSINLLESVLLNVLRRAKLEQELKAQQDRLEYLSFYDSLTGLANRALYFDRLKQVLQLAQRNNRTFAIMQIDLDLFKSVNDTYGHAVGDKVLIAVARRMSSCLRATDTVARLGGDEFAIVLTEINSPQDASLVADKISSVLREPILIDNHLIQIGSSIGIALYPEQGQNLDLLLMKADKAMYFVKRNKKSAMVYNEEMEVLAQQSLFLEANKLSLAIGNNELFLEYQPIINLSNRKVRSVEALVRWQPSDKTGIIYPGDFIPTAESSEAIYPLTYAVIDLALSQTKKWHDASIAMPVSINLSARMLDDSDLPKYLVKALDFHKLPATCVTLELTETDVMSNIEQAKKVFRMLNKMGIKISIDDFGVGFTSLKYLQELEVSEIKIDKAFTADLDKKFRSEIIIQSIAMLAKGLNTSIVIEGIEDIGLLQKLHRLGCQFGQGYGIALPMPDIHFPQWIQDWK